jgi:hypothetical protein
MTVLPFFNYQTESNVNVTYVRKLWKGGSDGTLDVQLGTRQRKLVTITSKVNRAVEEL